MGLIRASFPRRQSSLSSLSQSDSTQQVPLLHISALPITGPLLKVPYTSTIPFTSKLQAPPSFTSTWYSFGTSLGPPGHPLVYSSCEIKGKQFSESALLLFIQPKFMEKRLVIKILRKYKDNRYSLEDVNERQQCQLEALEWNRKFAPGVYIGLAPIYSHSIGAIISYPTKETLKPNTEYGLVMYELPKSRRLDVLLKEVSEDARWQYVELLAYYVAYMHTQLVEPPLSSKESLEWGSFKQVQSKLTHNLALLNLVLAMSENDQSNLFHWVTAHLYQTIPQNLYQQYLELRIKLSHGNLDIYNKLKNIFSRLKKNIHQVLRADPYEQYFEQRVQERRIKRCHGDLKAPHIWIEAYQWSSSEPWKHVFVLDTIDFNPMYNNIDILSDLAMLVIDIQARLKRPELADYLIKTYLRLTGQKDKVSTAVLTYYLVEKAVMWAAVSIVYDDLPELGIAFLEVAEKYMNDLNWNDLMPQADTLLTISSDVPLLSFHSKRNQSG